MSSIKTVNFRVHFGQLKWLEDILVYHQNKFILQLLLFVLFYISIRISKLSCLQIRNWGYPVTIDISNINMSSPKKTCSSKILYPKYRYRSVYSACGIFYLMKRCSKQTHGRIYKPLVCLRIKLVYSQRVLTVKVCFPACPIVNVLKISLRKLPAVMLSFLLSIWYYHVWFI